MISNKTRCLKILHLSRRRRLSTILFWSCNLFFSFYDVTARTWRDVLKEDHNGIDRPGNSIESDPFLFGENSFLVPSATVPTPNIFQPRPHSQPSPISVTTRSPSAIFVNPTNHPSHSRTTLPTQSPQRQTTKPPNPVYPENSVTPDRPPLGYFNYDASLDTSVLHGPGVPVMQFTNGKGYSVTYSNNGWAGVQAPVQG
jgi:hypothetical protein